MSNSTKWHKHKSGVWHKVNKVVKLEKRRWSRFGEPYTIVAKG